VSKWINFPKWCARRLEWYLKDGRVVKILKVLWESTYECGGGYLRVPLSIREIARRTGLHMETVRRLLGRNPRYRARLAYLTVQYVYDGATNTIGVTLSQLGEAVAEALVSGQTLTYSDLLKLIKFFRVHPLTLHILCKKFNPFHRSSSVDDKEGSNSNRVRANSTRKEGLILLDERRLLYRELVEIAGKKLTHKEFSICWGIWRMLRKKGFYAEEIFYFIKQALDVVSPNCRNTPTTVMKTCAKLAIKNMPSLKAIRTEKVKRAKTDKEALKETIKRVREKIQLLEEKTEPQRKEQCTRCGVVEICRVFELSRYALPNPPMAYRECIAYMGKKVCNQCFTELRKIEARCWLEKLQQEGDAL